jgi:hypothetical protein
VSARAFYRTIALRPESFGVQPVATDGRAVLHFATRSLFSRNDLVWHYLVYGTARVLDRVSESLFTLGMEP